MHSRTIKLGCGRTSRTPPKGYEPNMLPLQYPASKHLLLSTCPSRTPDRLPGLACGKYLEKDAFVRRLHDRVIHEANSPWVAPTCSRQAKTSSTMSKSKNANTRQRTACADRLRDWGCADPESASCFVVGRIWSVGLRESEFSSAPASRAQDDARRLAITSVILPYPYDDGGEKDVVLRHFEGIYTGPYFACQIEKSLSAICLPKHASRQRVPACGQHPRARPSRCRGSPPHP